MNSLIRDARFTREGPEPGEMQDFFNDVSGRCAFYHLQIATPLIRAFVNQNSFSCGCYFYGPISFFFFFFLQGLLRYNWHITSCKFKVYNGMIWDTCIYCKMIITIRLVYTSFTWCNYNFFLCSEKFWDLLLRQL